MITSRNLLIAGIVLGLLAVILVNMRISQIESRQQAVAVLRLSPSQSLAAGQVVEADMLETQLLPEDLESVTQVSIPDDPQSRAWVTGRKATRDVPAGSLLLYEFFADRPEERFAAKIADGKRAISIPVGPATAVSYFVEPGSRVDVLGTVARTGNASIDIPAAAAAQGVPTALAGGKKKIATRTLLQNVKVLAVGRATTRGAYLGQGTRGFQTVTLEVDPLEAEKIVFAMDEVQGNLTLVLRNPDDDQLAEIESVDWSRFDRAPAESGPADGGGATDGGE